MPTLLSPGRIPPIGRTLKTLWHLGRAITMWAVFERGRPTSRAGISRRMREACEALAVEVEKETGQKALAIGCHVGHWDECDTLAASAAVASAFGFVGTPAVVIEGVVAEGAPSLADLRAMIVAEAQRRDPPCPRLPRPAADG